VQYEKGNHPVCDETRPELNVDKTATLRQRPSTEHLALPTILLPLPQAVQLLHLPFPPFLPNSLALAFFSVIIHTRFLFYKSFAVLALNCPTRHTLPPLLGSVPSPSLLVHPCHSAGFSMIIPFRPPFRLLPFIKPSTTPHRLTQSLLAMNAPRPLLSPTLPASPTPVPRLNGAPVTLPRGPARTRTLALGMTWVNGGNLPVHTMATRKLLASRPRPPYKIISTARTMSRVWCTKRGSEQPTTMAIIVHRQQDEYVDTL
jgi:hypothetical protein